ncbi:MAG: hypothetical protein ACXAD7_27580 [Candidatus Kariarchaeaceae archaeon]|jgi:hypothetical protein
MNDTSPLISILRNLGKQMMEKEGSISVYASYNTWIEFGDHILKLTDDLEKGNKKAKSKLKMIFLPTSDWDDSGGIEGFDPDKILKLIDQL